MAGRTRAQATGTALTEGNEPEEGVVAEHGAHVEDEAAVVGHARVEGVVLLAALLAVLDGGVAAGD